jgi:hypothetical protein
MENMGLILMRLAGIKEAATTHCLPLIFFNLGDNLPLKVNHNGRL